MDNRIPRTKKKRKRTLCTAINEKSTWIVIAFLLESSWLPAQNQINNDIRIGKKKTRNKDLDYKMKRENEDPIEVSEEQGKGDKEKVPLAPFCFSKFLSRAILAFWPLPPSMAESIWGNREDKATNLLLFAVKGNRGDRW